MNAFITQLKWFGKKVTGLTHEPLLAVLNPKNSVDLV